MRKTVLRVAVAAGLVASLSTSARALDFSVSAPDEATLISVVPPALQVAAFTDPRTSVTTPAHVLAQAKLADGTEWVFSRWGLWWKPTGSTTTDAMGNTVPVLAHDGRFYAIGRWNGDPAHLPFAAAGWTVSTVAGVTTISKSGVTLTSPPVAGFPVGY